MGQGLSSVVAMQMKKLILPFLLLFLSSLCYAGSWSIQSTTLHNKIIQASATTNYHLPEIATLTDSGSHDIKLIVGEYPSVLIAADRIPTGTVIDSAFAVVHVLTATDQSATSIVLTGQIVLKPASQAGLTWNKANAALNWATAGANCTDGSGWFNTETTCDLLTGSDVAVDGITNITIRHGVSDTTVRYPLDTVFVNAVIRSGTEGAYPVALLLRVSSAGADSCTVCNDPRAGDGGGTCNNNAVTFWFYWTDPITTTTYRVSKDKAGNRDPNDTARSMK